MKNKYKVINLLIWRVSMQYRGIETEDKWINGTWFTYFRINGEIIKTVEWNGNFSEDDIKKIIDKQIIRFI